MAVFAVITEKGPNWDDGRQIRDQQAWLDHADFADELVERGIIILGGPIRDGNPNDIGLLVVEARDESELRSIFGDDLWTVSGVFRIKEAWPWTLWLDGRSKQSE